MWDEPHDQCPRLDTRTFEDDFDPYELPGIIGKRTNETHALLTIPHGKKALVIRQIEGGYHLITVWRCTEQEGVVYDSSEKMFPDYEGLMKEVGDELE